MAPAQKTGQFKHHLPFNALPHERLLEQRRARSSRDRHMAFGAIRLDAEPLVNTRMMAIRQAHPILLV